MFKDPALQKMVLKVNCKREVEGGEERKEVCVNGFRDSLLSWKDFPRLNSI